jgi:hypothetical protein
VVRQCAPGRRGAADLQDECATPDEEQSATARVREVYKRAVAQVPPGWDKRHWWRYIFLWLDCALYKEVEAKVCRIRTLPIVHISYFSILLQGLYSCTTGVSDCHDTRAP